MELLESEFQSPIPFRRYKALQDLKYVSASLGAQKTRQKVIPFLMDSLINPTSSVFDNELSLQMAKQARVLCGIERFGLPSAVSPVPYYQLETDARYCSSINGTPEREFVYESDSPELLGGPEFYELVFPILDLLVVHDEPTIRGEALESYRVILKKAPKWIFRVHQLLARVAESPEIQNKIAAAHLLTLCITFETEADDRTNSVSHINSLLNHEAALVRLNGVRALGECMPYLSASEIQHFGVQNWLADHLHGEPDEAIRAAWVKVYVRLSRKVTVDAHLFEAFCQLADGQSWRAHLEIVSRFDQILKSNTDHDRRSRLCQVLANYCAAFEPSVRTTGLYFVGRVAKIFEIEEFNQTLLPPFLEALHSADKENRQVAARSMARVCQRMGSEWTETEGITLIRGVLQDGQSGEVRNEIANSCCSLLSLLYTPTTLETDEDSLLGLFLGGVDDAHWRVRATMARQIAKVAQQFGPDFFVSHLQTPFITLLFDSVRQVRFDAMENLEQLGELLGAELAESSLVPAILAPPPPNAENDVGAGQHTYTFRQISIMALLHLSATFSTEVNERLIFPRLLSALKDPIWNVRNSTLELLKTIVQNENARFNRQCLSELKIVLESLNDHSELVNSFIPCL